LRFIARRYRRTLLLSSLSPYICPCPSVTLVTHGSTVQCIEMYCARRMMFYSFRQNFTIQSSGVHTERGSQREALPIRHDNSERVWDRT